MVVRVSFMPKATLARIKKCKNLYHSLYIGTLYNNISLVCMVTLFCLVEKYQVQFLVEVCEATLLSKMLEKSHNNFQCC